jgi:MFS family permease
MSGPAWSSTELADEPAVAHRRRGLIFLGLAVAAVGFAMSVQMGVNANFVADEMKLSGLQQGLLETFRETCGIAALGLLAVMAGLAEPLVGAAMLLLVAAGLGAYAFVPDYLWLVLTSLVWSQGLHVWMPLPQSMTLALAEPGRAGHRLGQIRAAGSVGSAAGLGAALLLGLAGVAIRPLYLLAGAAALLAAAACLGVPRRIKTPGPKVVFRRKYWLFYLLNFLEGWRKQIFIAFAGFLLVRHHNTSLRTMLLLWIAIQVIGWTASPMVGRLIDRLGERRILVFYFTCLTIFFVGYALIPNKKVLCALFVTDSAFFVFAMALTTYVGRVAPPSEYTPTLSMGVAANHVAAVTMPLVGGLLWKYVDYKWTFLVGAAAAALSILAALRLPPRATAKA